MTTPKEGDDSCEVEVNKVKMQKGIAKSTRSLNLLFDLQNML